MRDYLMLIISTVLFLQLTVSINRARIENATYMHESRYFNMAISLAHEVIDNAAVYPFEELGDFADMRTSEKFEYEGDFYSVKVSVENVYEDERGVELTEDNDMKRLEVIVTKDNTVVYVKLSQVFADMGV